MAPLYIWDQGSPTTLQTAEQSVNYSLSTPSQLPVGTSLVGVRFGQARHLVVLSYVVNGSSLSDSSTTRGIVIVEQWASSNPLPSSVTTYSAVVATTSFPNGTLKTSTIAPATTITIGWQTTTLGAQSMIVIAAPNNAQAEVEWWHNDVWYHIFATGVSLTSLESMAESMLSLQSTTAAIG